MSVPKNSACSSAGSIRLVARTLVSKGVNVSNLNPSVLGYALFSSNKFIKIMTTQTTKINLNC